MVSLVDITTGQVYQIPYNALNVSYQKQVMATTIAIPLSNSPILLNYGGDTISITVSFITTNQPDVSTLINQMSSAAGDIYELDLSVEWGMPYSGVVGTAGSFQGYVTAMNITQDSGTKNVWSCSFTLMTGVPE